VKVFVTVGSLFCVTSGAAGLIVVGDAKEDVADVVVWVELGVAVRFEVELIVIEIVVVI
jgi:hypothetical protein